MSAQQLVFDVELRSDTVGRLVVECLMGHGNWVTVALHVGQVSGGISVRGRTFHIVGWKHLVVVAGAVGRACDRVVGILPDAHVRHGVVGTSQDGGCGASVPVTVVVGVGQGEVRGEADAVTHVVVQHQTGGEAVEHLLDDRTGLVVVTARHTELGFLATTREGDVVVVSLTELVHFLHPVRILVEVVIIGRTALVVVDLDHVTCGCTLAWVEVCFFQHHGVAVAVEHVQPARSPGAGKTVREVDFCLTCHTTLGVDLDHTVRTARTPDS